MALLVLCVTPQYSLNGGRAILGGVLLNTKDGSDGEAMATHGRVRSIRDTAERDREIVKRRSEGQTCDEIGAHFGLTRGRVQQIAVKAGITGTVARARRNRRQVKSDNELRARAFELAMAGQASDIVSLAEQLGVDATRLSRVAGTSLTPYLTEVRRSNAGGSRWTRDQVLEGIRTAASYEYPLTRNTYTRLVRSGEVDGPSAPRVEQLFDGSWRRACEAAGVEAAQALRSNYQSDWTDEDLLSFVRRYVSEAGPKASFMGYDDWRRRDSGAPSGSTIRNRMGSWIEVRRAALLEEAAADGQ